MMREPILSKQDDDTYIHTYSMRHPDINTGQMNVGLTIIIELSGRIFESS